MYVSGDPDQLRQVTANLVDNAVKFTPEGGEVIVTLERQGAWALLAVEDTGIGTSEDELDRLFDRFYRGRNAGSHQGSGLGLPIVKAIVDAHGGALSVVITKGGSRFEVELPLAPS